MWLQDTQEHLVQLGIHYLLTSLHYETNLFSWIYHIRKTFRSSKNRRKHERKLLNLKEGGKFEDIALIDALYKQIQHIFEQQQQIHNICKALIEVRLDGQGRTIQALYRDLLTTVKDKMSEIWIPEMMSTQQTMFGPNVDYAQVQNDQHYAMIRKFFWLNSGNGRFPFILASVFQLHTRGSSHNWILSNGSMQFWSRSAKV